METSRSRRKSRIKTRPLTGTEKALLVLLGIVLVVWLGIRFILTPQQEKINNLQVDKLELENRIAEMNSVLRREKDIKAEWENLTKERSQILANYFPTLDQAQIIYLLNDMLPADQVDLADYGFTRPASEQIAEMEVKNMSVSVPFAGDYNGIMNMVRAVELSPRRMMIDSLTLDRASDSSLSGSMSVKVYSLEGLADTDPNVIPIVVAENASPGSLFGSFTGYVGNQTATGNGSSTGSQSGTSVGDPTPGVEEPVELKGDVIHSFETRNYEFIPSHSLVKGSAVPTMIADHGRYGLRLEYKILGVEDENRTYIDLSSQNLVFNYPPSELSLMSYSFNYSPGNIGVRILKQDGSTDDIIISNGVSWLGWGKININLLGDTTEYPIRMTHLFYEVAKERDDFGVLIFDKLEVFYSEHFEESIADDKLKLADYTFYEVQYGDTITSISRKIYGTEKFKNEIMSNNEIKSGDVLQVGKILVLVKR